MMDSNFSLSDLKAGGYSTSELKHLGRKIPELKILLLGSIGKLRASEFTVSQLKPAFTASEMKAAGFGIVDLTSGGYTSHQLKEAGFSVDEMKSVFSVVDLKNALFTASALHNSGCKVEDLKKAGFTASDLKEIQVSLLELKSVGFTSSELKEAGFTASEMMDSNFSLSDLKAGGYSTSELKHLGRKIPELKDVGFSDAEIKQGFTVCEMREAGLLTESFQDLYCDAFGEVSGDYIRGPIKHVDRAVSKAYRSYFGDFRRLTDIVRCSVVLNSMEDIQAFVKVRVMMHSSVGAYVFL
jgi:hypothetical protein